MKSEYLKLNLPVLYYNYKNWILMIITRISITLLAMKNSQFNQFCKGKPSGSMKMFIKNDNLVYEDANYKLITYFFLPQLRRTQTNAFEIYKYSNVLSFVWQPKQKKEISSQSGLKGNKQEQNKYQELHSLLEVGPKSAATATIQRKRKTATNDVHQKLTLIDNPQQKFINYNYNSSFVNIESKAQSKSNVNFQFSYSQFRIFDILLRKSLFELSGMGLVYELRRQQEINSEQNEQLRTRQQIEKQAEEFYKK